MHKTLGLENPKESLCHLYNAVYACSETPARLSASSPEQRPALAYDLRILHCLILLIVALVLGILALEFLGCRRVLPSLDLFILALALLILTLAFLSLALALLIPGLLIPLLLAQFHGLLDSLLHSCFLITGPLHLVHHLPHLLVTVLLNEQLRHFAHGNGLRLDVSYNDLSSTLVLLLFLLSGRNICLGSGTAE